jgi:hypothetical protein
MLARLWVVVSLALVVVATAAAPARAQQGGGQEMDWGALSRSPVGTWAEYTMKSAQASAKIRFALVEKSEKRMVIEIDTELGTMGTMLARTEYEPAGPDAWKVTAAKVKMGAETRTIPPEQLAQQPLLKKGGVSGKLVGTETITTPIGKFECKHYKKTTQAGTMTVEFDTWVSDKALPTGIVKSVASAMGVEILLAHTGKDAVSKMK